MLTSRNLCLLSVPSMLTKGTEWLKKIYLPEEFQAAIPLPLQLFVCNAYHRKNPTISVPLWMIFSFTIGMSLSIKYWQIKSTVSIEGAFVKADVTSNEVIVLSNRSCSFIIWTKENRCFTLYFANHLHTGWRIFAIHYSLIGLVVHVQCRSEWYIRSVHFRQSRISGLRSTGGEYHRAAWR